MSQRVLDCRGVEIKVGATVVRCGQGTRLREDRVKDLRFTDNGWVWVHLHDGMPTTPDRVAVITRGDS